jgi:hypothetical protein
LALFFTIFTNLKYKADRASGNAFYSGADLTYNGCVTLDDLIQFVENCWLFGAE